LTAAAGIVLFELFHRLAAALPDEGSGGDGTSPLSVLPLLAQEIAQARHIGCVSACAWQCC
jgi:hypothetical protein